MKTEEESTDTAEEHKAQSKEHRAQRADRTAFSRHIVAPRFFDFCTRYTVETLGGGTRERGPGTLIESVGMNILH